MDKTFFEQPNEHYVARLMSASDKSPIVTTEDIYDNRGIKLLARGKPITVSLRERLLASKLNKPLETCLQIENGLKPADIVGQVQKILEEKPTIAALAGKHAGGALELFNRIHLTGLPYLQLSTIATDGSGAYEHAVMTALIGALLALRLGLPESVTESAIMAGLTHDLGELYVNPELMRGQRELTFEEWKHIAVHPRIGAVLLAEYGKFPAVIVRAVQEHHERLDGSGYPYGIANDHISQLGRIMMVSEVLSAILPARENPESRALLALRLVHQQFDRSIVAVLSEVYHDHGTSIPHGFNMPALGELANAIDQRLKLCQQEVEKVYKQTALPDSWIGVAEHARELSSFLSMSLHSSGVLSVLRKPGSDVHSDPGIANELHVIVTELKWRMRALSRHVALTVGRWERASEVFDGVIRSLYLDDPRSVPPANTGGLSTLAA